MALALSRRKDQTILIFKDGGDAEDAVAITVGKIKGGYVMLHFEAADHMKIVRKELLVEGNTWGKP